MKRTLLLIMVALIAILTACEIEPIIDERCYGDYENFTFFEIEEDGPLGTTQSRYMFETPHGPIAISDNVYEGAMNYEYLEICYEREDGIAASYLYTKKGQDLQPEPEIVIETVTETVIEYVDVPVTIQSEFDGIRSELPTYVEVLGNIGWILYPITDEDLYTTDPDTGEQVRLYSNFANFDTLLFVFIYEPHTISDDLVFMSQVSVVRNGMIVQTLGFEPQEFTPTTLSFDEYAEDYIANIDLQEVYEMFNPPGVPE